MADAGTVAVLLPGAYATVGATQPPPVAIFRKHEVDIAVATDAHALTGWNTTFDLNMLATRYESAVQPPGRRFSEAVCRAQARLGGVSMPPCLAEQLRCLPAPRLASALDKIARSLGDGIGVPLRAALARLGVRLACSIGVGVEEEDDDDSNLPDAAPLASDAALTGVLGSLATRAAELCDLQDPCPAPLPLTSEARARLASSCWLDLDAVPKRPFPGRGLFLGSTLRPCRPAQRLVVDQSGQRLRMSTPGKRPPSHRI